jgi:hypothetical protein
VNARCQRLVARTLPRVWCPHLSVLDAELDGERWVWWVPTAANLAQTSVRALPGKTPQLVSVRHGTGRKTAVSVLDTPRAKNKPKRVGHAEPAAENSPKALTLSGSQKQAKTSHREVARDG